MFLRLCVLTGFSPAPETTPIISPEYHEMLKACEDDYYAMEARKLTLKLA